MQLAKLDNSKEKSISEGHVQAMVKERLDDGWLLEAGGLQFVAIKAVSCLLMPETGDRVLCFTQGDSAWLLAVLERLDTDSTTVIETESDLALRSKSGCIELAAKYGVELSAEDLLTLTAPRLRFTAHQAETMAGQLNWICDSLEARFDSGQLVGGSLDTVVERSSLSAKRAFREVSDIEQLRAGQIDYQVKGSMNLQARQILADAEQLTRIDGGQIHLG